MVTHALLKRALLNQQVTNLEEDNRIELSPATNQWNGFQGRLLTMSSIFHCQQRIVNRVYYADKRPTAVDLVREVGFKPTITEITSAL